MKIVLLDGATLGNTDLNELKTLGELTTYPHTNLEQVVSRSIEADVIITNKVRIDEQALKQLPKLKLICVAATGTNNIDLEAAKNAGVTVCNVAGYSTPSVVQHTFTMLGNLLTNMHRYHQDCQQGLWQKSDMFCRLDHSITEIAGKNFVIFGYGTLGQAVAKVADAFGANVIIAERPHVEHPRAGRVSFEQALQCADILSIHCPLTPDTHMLFDEVNLAQLKASAILINTARGGIVDETALVNALKAGSLAAAGFDVLSVEPAQADNPLINYKGDNLMLTPHTAWAAAESIARLVTQIAKNIVNYQLGTPSNQVN